MPVAYCGLAGQRGACPFFLVFCASKALIRCRASLGSPAPGQVRSSKLMHALPRLRAKSYGLPATSAPKMIAHSVTDG